MAICYMCKKDVTSGYVLCGDCAKELRTNAIPHIIEYYIARLADSIAHDSTVYPCPMCEIEDCRLGKEGVSTYDCHKGISDWLRSKAVEFLSNSTPGILGKLKMVCPFPQVFENLEADDSSHEGEPRSKIGHIRANYDEGRWWSTVWALHWDLVTVEMKDEIDRTYEALTASDALSDLNALHRFCWSHPEAEADPNVGDEYNFYLEGETCNFWLRLITRDKDYNMYLNVYAKPANVSRVNCPNSEEK